MQVTVWEDTFEIRPNKYRNVGEYVKRYNVYSSEEDRGDVRGA